MLCHSLFIHALNHGEAPAIIDDGGCVTYQELATRAEQLGGYLATQTTRPRVGLLLPSGAAFVASFYGTLLAGKAVVPLNFLLSDRDLSHCIADSGIDTVVTVRQLALR